MDQKKQRQHLRDYTLAARQIELSGVAVNVLEGMNTTEAQQAIKVLQRGGVLIERGGLHATARAAPASIWPQPMSRAAQRSDF